MPTWIDACGLEDIDVEDVIPFEYGGMKYALYRSEDSEYFATDGHCTHGRQLLCDGLDMGNLIECPKHHGRFDYRTGAPMGPPVLEAVRTYPTRVEEGRVLIDIE